MTYCIQKVLAQKLPLLDLYRFEKVFGYVKAPLHVEEKKGDFMCPFCFHPMVEIIFDNIFGCMDKTDPRYVGIRYEIYGMM